MPEKDPLMIQWARWCWRQPRCIGIPLSLGIFMLCFVDLIYLIYWLVRNWGKEGENGRDKLQE